MLMHSLGHEFGPGPMRMACLCSVMSRASVGKDLNSWGLELSTRMPTRASPCGLGFLTLWRSWIVTFLAQRPRAPSAGLLANEAVIVSLLSAADTASVVLGSPASKLLL